MAGTTLERIKMQLGQACLRVGRDPAAVRLIAVTKGRSLEAIERRILSEGHTLLGESRVQEWRDKRDALRAAQVEWHLIGTLQTNKVKYCRDFHTLHTLNSERLADALARHATQRGHRFRVLLEVNVAGETQKQGVGVHETAGLLRFCQSLPELEVAGLMTIAPYTDDAQKVRPVFRTLRELRDSLGLTELSMGMSGDFEVAAEEGATYVRVGTALFT